MPKRNKGARPAPKTPGPKVSKAKSKAPQGPRSAPPKSKASSPAWEEVDRNVFFRKGNGAASSKKPVSTKRKRAVDDASATKSSRRTSYDESALASTEVESDDDSGIPSHAFEMSDDDSEGQVVVGNGFQEALDRADNALEGNDSDSGDSDSSAEGHAAAEVGLASDDDDGDSDESAGAGGPKRELFGSDDEGESGVDSDEEELPGPHGFRADEEDEVEDEDDEEESEEADRVLGDIEGNVGPMRRGESLEQVAAEKEARQAQQMEEAMDDMRLHVEGDDVYRLPTEEEIEAEQSAPPDLSAIHRRIQEVVQVLLEFRKRRDPMHSRADYIDRLTDDCANYYGYNRELVELFLRLFPPREAFEFFEANEQPRPVTIRVNTLKTRRRDLAQALIARGVNVDPLASWTKVGLVIFESPVPIGATPEYLTGQYFLQSASSMMSVVALGPKPGERILDMCAAPGGKTSHIAQEMRNSGVLVANDMKKERIPSLVANLARMGVSNAVVCQEDARKLPTMMKRGFDRVLLDAPCTGLGVISKDPSAKTQRSYEDIYKLSHLQKQLILAAIDAVDARSATGGVVVYSTCSVTVEENEAVVDYALNKRDVKLLPIRESGEDVGLPGMTAYQTYRFHPTMTLTRRFLPHVHNMDGFFVAKFQKLSNKVKGKGEVDPTQAEYAVGKLAKKQKTKKKNKAKKADALEQAPAEHVSADEDGKGAASLKPKAKAKAKKGAKQPSEAPAEGGAVDSGAEAKPTLGSAGSRKWKTPGGASSAPGAAGSRKRKREADKGAESEEDAKRAQKRQKRLPVTGDLSTERAVQEEMVDSAILSAQERSAMRKLRDQRKKKGEHLLEEMGMRKGGGEWKMAQEARKVAEQALEAEKLDRTEEQPVVTISRSKKAKNKNKKSKRGNSAVPEAAMGGMGNLETPTSTTWGIRNIKKRTQPKKQVKKPSA